ncbi:MAG: PilZ domain-containing protein [Candidatus Omnitrophota bacterium]
MADGRQSDDTPPFFSPRAKDPAQDKRYLPRWQVSSPVYFRPEEDPRESTAETVDLSCAGACLKTDKVLLPGQRISMRILLSKERELEIGGRVVWNRIASQGRRFAGVSFTGAGLQEQEILLNHAFEIRPQDLRQHWFAGWDGASSENKTAQSEE